MDVAAVTVEVETLTRIAAALRGARVDGRIERGHAVLSAAGVEILAFRGELTLRRLLPWTELSRLRQPEAAGRVVDWIVRGLLH
jgi:hypothetical protein